MAFQDVQDFRAVSSHPEPLVLLGVVKLHLVHSRVVVRHPFEDGPAAACPARLTIEHQASQRVAFCRHGRLELLVQLHVLDALGKDQSMEMHRASTMVVLGCLFPLAVLELQTAHEVHLDSTAIGFRV